MQLKRKIAYKLLIRYTMVNSISYNILMGDLEPLSKIIKGSNEPIFNRELIEVAKQVLKQVKYGSFR